MGWPLSFTGVSITAGGYDVDTGLPGEVSPFFMREDEFGKSTATEAAIEDVVAAFNRFRYSCTDEMGP
jgi:hypothetical protein